MEMDRSSYGCPEHLIEFLTSHLSPGAVDPHAVFDHLDWHDERAVEVAIAHAYRDYEDQSWAATMAERWIQAMSQAGADAAA